MKDESSLQEELQRILPAHLQDQAKILAQALIKAKENYSQGENPDNISISSDLAPLLDKLAGKEIKTESSVVTFGENNQVGDVSIRDTAGRDINNFTIHIFPTETKANLVFRKTAFIIGGIVIIASLIYLVLIQVEVSNVESTKIATPATSLTPVLYSNAIVITNQELNVRSLPYIQSDYKLATVSAGEEVIITGYTAINGQNWYRVDVPSRNLRNVWIVRHLGERETVIIEDGKLIDRRLYIPFSEATPTRFPWQP